MHLLSSATPVFRLLHTSANLHKRVRCRRRAEVNAFVLSASVIGIARRSTRPTAHARRGGEGERATDRHLENPSAG